MQNDKASFTAESVAAIRAVEPVGDGPGDPEMSWWILKRRQEWLEHYEMIGEPFKFGLPEGTIEAFLVQRGFHKVVNATCKDMRNALATSANSKRELTCPGWRLFMPQ